MGGDKERKKLDPDSDETPPGPQKGGGKGGGKNLPLSLNRIPGIPTTISNQKMYSQTLPPEFRPKSHMYAHDMGSGLKI